MQKDVLFIGLLVMEQRKEKLVKQEKLLQNWKKTMKKVKTIEIIEIILSNLIFL